MSIVAPEKIEKQLPTPDERPGSDVVIYDGHCKFCRAQVRKLVWWDCQKRLSYISLHDPEVARRYPDLTHDMLMEQMYVVDHDGNRYGGAAAFRYLTRRLRRLWWLMPVMHIPLSLPLWQFCYRFIAKHRYWFGKVEQCDDDACSVHFR
jgi:predicted DCC family thiol-disulfide oxidoreductase YuxK